MDLLKTIILYLEYIIYISKNISEKRFVFSILHELSHIQLHFLGNGYEKKRENSFSEKYVNINLIMNNACLLRKIKIPYYLILALFSEKLLYQKIKILGVD